MGVRAHASAPPPRARSRGPGVFATLVVVLVTFGLLVANGRALSAPETTGAAAWVLKAGLALGTTLAAATQAWSGEAAATCAVAVALLLLVRANEDDAAALAALAGLPLGVAVALQPSSAALALVLVLAVLVRFRLAGVLVLAWAAPGVLIALGSLLGGPSAAPAGATPAASGDGPGAAALALLASPAKGILLFAPVVLVAIVGVFRVLRAPRSRLWDQAQPGRFLPVACLLAAIAHVAWVAATGGWDQGPFWGPRLMAPACPLLLLFLPEGLATLQLEIRIVGGGTGRIGVAESGSGSGTRWRDEAVAGPFRLRLPYFFADSGGADVRVVLRGGGPMSIESVALVPPSDPENVPRVP